MKKLQLLVGSKFKTSTDILVDLFILGFDDVQIGEEILQIYYNDNYYFEGSVMVGDSCFDFDIVVKVNEIIDVYVKQII